MKSIFKFQRIEYKEKYPNENQNSLVVSGVKFILDFNQKSQTNENSSLQSKVKYYKNEIKFFTNKLNNKNFIKKAPSEIVEEQKRKLKEAEKNLKLLIKR